MLVTNRGKQRFLEWALRNANEPTNLYILLATSATAPTSDMKTVSEVTEVTAGNGYTSGGFQLNRNATDFDSLSESDGSNTATIQVKDVAWTASGGNLPVTAARYALLTDDDATVADREILAAWDLEEDGMVGDGQTLTLQNLTITLLEVVS